MISIDNNLGVLRMKMLRTFLIFQTLLIAFGSYNCCIFASKESYESGEFTSFTFGKGYKPQPRENIYIKELHEENGEILDYFEVETQRKPKASEIKEIEGGCLLNLDVDNDLFAKINDLLQRSDIHSEKDLAEKEGPRLLPKEEPSSNIAHIEESLLSKSRGDRRLRVPSPKQAPWSFNGRLRVYFESRDEIHKSIICLGSGVMIGPDLTLTCAHNLYLSPLIQSKYPYLDPYAKIATFLPGINGKQVFEESKVDKAIIAPEWVKSNDPGQDLALLHLEKSLGLKVGYSAMDVIPLKEELVVSITGYPGELQDQMYTMNGPIKQIRSHKIFYDIDTTSGNSGSPISIIPNDIPANPICIGIHTTGAGALALNGGIYINQEKFNKIGGWVNSIQQTEEEQSLSALGESTKGIKRKLSSDSDSSVKKDSKEKEKDKTNIVEKKAKISES
jgi:glutamyl endopeptidase